MRLSRRWLAWSAVVVVPVLVLLLLVENVVHDPDLVGPTFHFFIVSFTAFVALLLAILMAIAAGELRDVRAYFLSLAFIGIAGIFLVHALTTPGALVPADNPWAGVSARLCLLVGAVFFALSTVDWPERMQDAIMSRQARLTSGFAGLIVLYGAVALIDCFRGGTNDAFEYAAMPGMPGMASAAVPHPPVTHLLPVMSGMPPMPPLPSADHATVAAPANLIEWLAMPGPSWAFTIMVLGLLGIVIYRYTHLFRVSRMPLVGGFLISAIFLAQAQLSMTIAPAWHASWWEYHVLLLAGFCAASFGLVKEYSRSGSLQDVVEGLLLRGTIAQLQRGYTDVIVALVGAVEAKDPYTRGHTQRVAELSVLIGQELHLSPERLRILNQSAMLHDIGKIGIPDQILNKPGPLTDEEFSIVKQHPERGHQIIERIRSLQQEVGGVRHHHERLDGSGYPDGLSGDQIPLDARIIAVADVFDALTSKRSYRDAWPVEQALRQLDAEAGTRLDPTCVAALHRALPSWSRAGTLTSSNGAVSTATLRSGPIRTGAFPTAQRSEPGGEDTPCPSLATTLPTLRRIIPR